MKKIIILFCLTLSLNGTSQTNEKSSRDIDYISFKYNCSSVVFTDVEISIFNSNRKNKPIEVKVKYYDSTIEKTKRLRINQEEFYKIKNQFYKINNFQLLEEIPITMDACSVELKIGNFLSHNIAYKLEGLSTSLFNTNLKDLIITIQMILKVALIKIDGFN